MSNQCSKSKILNVILFSLLTCGILSACGVDTTADINARQKERDKETSDYLQGLNAPVKGVYHGTTSSADIYLNVVSTKMPQVGAMTPQATIVGTLIVVPRVGLVLNSGPIQDAFPFTDGSFDGSHTIAFTLEKGTPTQSIVSCDIDKNMTLACNWEMFFRESFDLKRMDTTSIKALTVKSKTDEFYTGHNKEIGMAIQFRAGMKIPDGSQVAAPTINGTLMVFDASLGKDFPSGTDAFVNYPFYGAIYSSVSEIISISVADPRVGTVNCNFINSSSMDCTLQSGQTVTVHRALKK